jgi:hypothetical protein
LQVNDTWIARALDDGLDLFPRASHHGLLQQSFVYDAMQCGSGSLQQQLLQMGGHLPSALCDQRALQVILFALGTTCPPSSLLSAAFPLFFPVVRALLCARTLSAGGFSRMRRRCSTRSCRVSRKRAPSRQLAASRAVRRGRLRAGALVDAGRRGTGTGAVTMAAMLGIVAAVMVAWPSTRLLWLPQGRDGVGEAQLTAASIF